MADDADRAADIASADLTRRLSAVLSVTRGGTAPESEFCEDCGDIIPEARRLAAPWATRCVHCQEEIERG